MANKVHRAIIKGRAARRAAERAYVATVMTRGKDTVIYVKAPNMAEAIHFLNKYPGSRGVASICKPEKAERDHADMYLLWHYA